MDEDDDDDRQRAGREWARLGLTPPRALYGYYAHGDWGGPAEEAYPSLHAAMVTAHRDAAGGELRDPQWVYDGTTLYGWDGGLRAYFAAHGLTLRDDATH